MLEAQHFLVLARRYILSKNDRLSALFYNKLLNRDKKNSKRTARMPVLEKSVSLSRKTFEDVNFTHFQRVNVLNKIFMKSITEIMSTGKIDSLFNNKGLQITKLQVAPNFGGVNIFWISHRDKSEFLEQYLFEYAKFLRQELTSLRVIGYVPQIVFVKDKKHDMLTVLDEKLQEADFGDDFEPTTIVQLQKDFKLDRNEPKATNERIVVENPIETNLRPIGEEEEEEQSNDSLPVMTHDVFGVKHDQILQRVVKSMRKACAFHRTETGDGGGDGSDSSDKTQTGSSIERDPVEFASKKDENEAFEQFLRNRKADKIRLYKEKNKSKQQDKDDFDALLTDNDFEESYEPDNGDEYDYDDEEQFKDTN